MTDREKLAAWLDGLGGSAAARKGYAEAAAALRSITEIKTCWVVWVITSTGVQLVAVCTSAATANKYRADAASLYPHHRMYVEEATLDHLFGASDLRSVAYRAALAQAAPKDQP